MVWCATEDPGLQPPSWWMATRKAIRKPLLTHTTMRRGQRLTVNVSSLFPWSSGLDQLTPGAQTPELLHELPA